MKKLIAVAAIITLSACGGDAVSEEVVAEEIAVAEVSPAVGSYTGSTEDGSAWSSVLNEDGSYVDTVAGEVTETGSWTDADGQVCFVPDVTEGEEPEPTTCYTLSEPAEDGMVTVTNAEGEVTTVQKTMS